MKFAEMVASVLKSLGGSDPNEEEKEKEDGGSENPDQNQEENGDEEQDDDTMEKSGTDDLFDVTTIMKALVGEFKAVNKSLNAIAKRQDGLEKAQEDVGDAVVGVAAIVAKLANAPMPTKAAMAKSVQGGNAGDGKLAQLTKAEFEQGQVALTKACKEKRITLFDATRLESEMQKAMQIPGYRMKPADAALIAKELKTA